VGGSNKNSIENDVTCDLKGQELLVFLKDSVEK